MKEKKVFRTSMLDKWLNIAEHWDEVEDVLECARLERIRRWARQESWECGWSAVPTMGKIRYAVAVNTKDAVDVVWAGQLGVGDNWEDPEVMGARMFRVWADKVKRSSKYADDTEVLYMSDEKGQWEVLCRA